MATQTMQFLEALKERRTIYQLKNESPIPDGALEDIIKQAILHVPSSFNSQSERIILLVKEEHEKLWEITKEVLKAIVPPESWSGTEGKLNGFKGAYGTVLFYQDRKPVQDFQNKYSIYADKFPTWAAQSDAMHQYAVWTAFHTAGLGCNLQHYNPLIDQKVASTWNVDADWELSAQLVFGTKAGEAGPKEFQSVESRFKVFGA